MHVKFRVVFTSDGEGTLGYADLDVDDLPFAPSPELDFEHPVWDDARQPSVVSYNLEDHSFCVMFIEKSSKAEIAQVKKVYDGHGWDATNVG